MRSSVGRLIVLVIVLGFTLIVLSETKKVWSREMSEMSENSELVAAYPSGVSMSFFDPTRISVIEEYFMIENLYSQLLMRNIGGEIIPGMATEVAWINDKLVFKIRPNMIASDNLPITIDDVVFSLKRLGVRGGSHSDLSTMLGGVVFKSINDNYPEIVVDGDKLILSIAAKDRVYLDSFASGDFSIVPRRSVDQKTLEITDYSITSGVYFMKKSENDGEVTLQSNPRHFQYNGAMPQKIRFKRMNNQDDLIGDLEQHKIDYIPAVFTLPSNRIASVSKDSDVLDVHFTQKIKVYFAETTDKFKRLSQKNQLQVFSALLAAYASKVNPSVGLDETSQYFSEGGFGSLSKEQSEKIEYFRAQARKETGIYLDAIKIGALNSRSVPFRNMFLPHFPNGEIVDFKFTDDEWGGENKIKDYHFRVGNIDTGFFEDFPQLNMTANAGVFGLTKAERKQFLKSYQVEQDPHKRQAMLQKVHFDSLMNLNFIPLIRAPYVSVIRKPWKMNFSPYFATNPFWRIHR